MKKIFAAIRAGFKPAPKEPTLAEKIEERRERTSARLLKLALHHGIENEAQLVAGVASVLNWINEARSQGFAIAKIDPSDPREFCLYDRCHLLAPKYKDEDLEPMLVRREAELSEGESVLLEEADDIADDIADDEGLLFGEVALRAMKHYEWSLRQAKRGFDVGARSGDTFERSPAFEEGEGMTA